jgi:hypothetical protein
MVDGANFENLIVSDVIIRDAATPLFLRLGNRGRGQTTPVAGTLRNVQFNNIIATGGTLASSITGLAGHFVENVSLNNIDITMMGGGKKTAVAVPEASGDYPHAPMFGSLPASVLYTRHVRGLSLTDVRLRTMKHDDRPTLVLDDVTRVARPSRK